MKTKLMILIILFLIFTASIGSALEFMHEESEIARLCSKGYFGGPPNSFAFRTMSNLSQRINGDYPGSTINCNTGAGIFVINARRYYFNNWKIIRMTETGNNSLDYEISEYGRYWKASDGKNYVKVEPDRGLFIDVYLPILAETANITGKNQVVSFRHNELMKLLNAFYANNKQFGEIYGVANSLLLDPSFRETFLTWSEQYLVSLTPEKSPATSTPKNNEIFKAPKGEKPGVTPEETAKCTLELRSALEMARIKLGVYDKSKKNIPTAEMEKAIDKVIEEFKKSACFPVLQTADKYLDKDMEFTRAVDAILAKEKK